MRIKRIRCFLRIVLPIFLACMFRAIVLAPSLAFAQNQPPVANAGPDVNAYTNDRVMLDGSAYDPDGDTIQAWTWEVAQMPVGGRYRMACEDTDNLLFLGYVQGDYVLRLGVWDGYPTGFGVDYATVHVADNQPPVAIATADKTSIAVGEEVCFDGSQSYDPEGRPFWRVTWDFGDGSIPVVNQLAVCHSFLSAGLFQVRLRVTDEREVTDFDDMLISVGCLDVSPDSQDFGNTELGTSTSIIFTVTNNCSRDTSVSGMSLAAGGSPSFAVTQTPTLPVTLIPNATADLQVTFTPGTIGPHEATLLVQNDNSYVPTISVPLRGAGVKTEPPPVSVGVILDLFDTAVEAGTLTGDGPGSSAAGRMGALRNMIEAVDDLIVAGDYQGACTQLKDAYNRCDGEPKPPDFVTGEDAADLAAYILNLSNDIGCE